MAAGERAVVEKLMTLSRAEFEKSLSIFLGRPCAPGTESALEPLSTGSVEIRYEALPGVRLGGLLELPRALVRLTFEDIPEAEREAYLRRFDIAFQRGGG